MPSSLCDIEGKLCAFVTVLLEENCAFVTLFYRGKLCIGIQVVIIFKIYSAVHIFINSVPVDRSKLLFLALQRVRCVFYCIDRIL